jgi:hypothetical protein
VADDGLGPPLLTARADPVVGGEIELVDSPDSGDTMGLNVASCIEVR